MRKLLSTLLAIAMLAGMLLPVAALGETNEPITIQFWNGWSGSDGDVLIEMVDRFNETNPYNITIEMDINSEFLNKIAAEFAADSGPQLILGANNFKDLYVGYLLPLNEIFEKTALKQEDFIAGYVDSCSTDGEIFVLPFQVTARYMYWNKDLFAAAGLDPEVPPASYAEWSEMAAKITNEDANVYGSGLSYTATVTNAAIMQRMGGNFVDYDDNGEFVPLFEGNEGFVKFGNWMKELIDSGNNPMETDTTSMFKAGQIGIMADGAWTNSALQEIGLNYGVGLLPYDDAGKVLPTSVSGFAITKYTTEAEVMACYRFLEWWYNGDENTDVSGALRWSLDCGYPTYYLPVANDPRYQASELLAAMTNTDNEVDTTFWAPSAFAQTFTLSSEVIQPFIDKVVISGEDPLSVLNECQSAAQAIIDAAKK